MSHLRTRTRFVAAVAALLIGLVGCSSSAKNNSTVTASTTSGPAATAAPAAATGGGAVTIKNFAFSPTPLSAKAGDTITITNNDTTDHTVTDGGGAFDTGHIAPGSSKTITVTKAGTYNYHCNIHQSMKGVIQITA